MRMLDSLGAAAVRICTASGQIAITLGRAILWAFRPPFRYRVLVTQLDFIGVQSLLVILMTGAFTGMVLALQLYIGFSKFHAEYLVGGVAAIAITRELGPVLSALMIAARAGSAMAAELGTMRVTEQVDALEAMAVEPVQYLVTPRVISALLMFPVLTLIADIVGIAGSWLVGVHFLGINSTVYLNNMTQLVELRDVLTGLVKAAAFGVAVSAVSCTLGLRATQGARGVGRATTAAVVVSSTMILILDYVLTALMF